MCSCMPDHCHWMCITQPDAVAFLLDYTGPDGFPQQLARHVADVVVLDHHKSAAESLADTSSHPRNLHVLMDMNRSGATIARDFFNPPGLSNQVQQMYRWVEDADLWRWQLPDSKAFHAGLTSRLLEYNAVSNPQVFDQLLTLDAAHVIQQGHTMLQRQEELIAEALSTAHLHQLGGAQGLTRGWGSCLGCRVDGEVIRFRSMLGNRLALKSQGLGLSSVGLVAYTEPDMPSKDTNIKVSLRSVADYDTTAISSAFGGGGHAAASSCIITIAELDAWAAMARKGRRIRRRQPAANNTVADDGEED
eukprot:GHRR01030965.1.p1 GENE.GHRR01030965.1~~GHRR01030965.1.p1  ORF type:complete len:305 (+),score=111.17 GHRR01030965.1:144-1058(+)